MKIILAGDGTVGEALLGLLTNESCDITVIDKNKERLSHCSDSYDVITVLGNCAVMEVLMAAGAAEADLLIATTGSDEINLLTSMTARAINPDIRVIARIRDPEYNEQAYRMRNMFGISMLFNPEREAAREMLRLIKLPGFLKRDTFAKGRVEIVEIKVDRTSPLNQTPLSSLHSIVGCRVLVCAVLRDGESITPGGDFVLEDGDRIFVTAPTDNLALLLKNLGIVTRKNKRVIIVGGSKTAYYLAEGLLAAGIHVTIVERDEARCRELSGMLPKAEIISANAADMSTLEESGIDGADAIVTATGSDEFNIVLSLFAAEHGTPQIITKLSEISDLRVIDKLPIGSVISPERLICNNIVRYVRAIQNQTGAAAAVHSIADGKTEALEFVADASLGVLGIPLKKLRIHKNILIASITRRGVTEIPCGDSYIEEGDSVLLVCSREEPILSLSEIFAE